MKIKTITAKVMIIGIFISPFIDWTVREWMLFRTCFYYTRRNNKCKAAESKYGKKHLLLQVLFLVTRTGIIAFSPLAKRKVRLGLSCCGVRHLPVSTVLLGRCRPRPLAQVACSATGGAPIAPPRRQQFTGLLHLIFRFPFVQQE
ncbi:MAG: hypothetical protein IKY18_04995 [Oscillospiraceae bacterium]|nr:hypothetical protein [Oscillospiraceae bacterium]